MIPTKTIPQGISALISFDETATAEANQAGMEDAITAVKSGQVTYAVRDTSIDGKEIKTGDYMGIDDVGIQAVGQDITEVVKDLIGAMADASYKKSVFHVERYQEKVLSKGHEIINHYDKLLEKETDAGKRMALKTEANNAVADMVKKEAADTLDKVLFELCGQMKNAFARSDA